VQGFLVYKINKGMEDFNNPKKFIIQLCEIRKVYLGERAMCLLTGLFESFILYINVQDK